MNIFKKAVDTYTTFKECTTLESRNPNPNYVPPASVVTPKNTMYGLKLYIPFEDLSQYIHENVEDVYKDHTFIPVKVEINEVGLDIEISLVSAVPVECDKRYKLDINKLSKER